MIRLRGQDAPKISRLVALFESPANLGNERLVRPSDPE